MAKTIHSLGCRLWAFESRISGTECVVGVLHSMPLPKPIVLHWACSQQSLVRDGNQWTAPVTLPSKCHLVVGHRHGRPRRTLQRCRARCRSRTLTINCRTKQRSRLPTRGLHHRLQRAVRSQRRAFLVRSKIVSAGSRKDGCEL